MDAKIPLTVLVINNNPNSVPGYYTQLIIEHVRKAGLSLHEARTVEAVDAYANSVSDNGNDVGLIITCGSSVVLTQPVDVSAHVTKTTAAMLHFPNAPVVGICFGMQLLAQLYGGTLTECKEARGEVNGEWAEILCVEGGPPAHLFEGLTDRFLQWATNRIFLDWVPPRFVVTAKDTLGRVMAMAHTREHVYGLQFHPEVIHEVTGCRILDNMFALVGQNRRRTALCQRKSSLGEARAGPVARPLVSPTHAWCCSKECHLRRAVKEITKNDLEADVIECTCRNKGRGSQNLGYRLSAARRKALATLRNDHCRDGGITVEALEDAISTLRQIADADSCPAKSKDILESPTQQESEELTYTTHGADLRLREVVKDVLQSCAASTKAGSSRASSCSNSTGATAATAPWTILALDAQHVVHDLGRATPVRVPCNFIVMHEADLRLRAAVKEVLQERGGVGPNLGQCLAAARREALSALRRDGAGTNGSVAVEAVEAQVAMLRSLTER